MGAIRRKLVRASLGLKGQFQPRKPLTGKPITVKEKAELNLKLAKNTVVRSQAAEKMQKTFDAEIDKLIVGEKPVKSIMGLILGASKAQVKARKAARDAFVERRKKVAKLMKQRAEKTKNAQ